MTGCPLLDSEYAARQNGKRLPCERLAEENAKLRELVQSFHSAMLCTLDTGMWPTDPEWLEHRMCELGVEVDA